MELTVGAAASAGSGTVICTLCRSNAALASYSMLTYDWAPDSEGQQLMVSGTSDSSAVWKRHLSTPRGAPVGKGRCGSLSPSTLSPL
jgi:hypothetical protein